MIITVNANTLMNADQTVFSQLTNDQRRQIRLSFHPLSYFFVCRMIFRLQRHDFYSWHPYFIQIYSVGG